MSIYELAIIAIPQGFMFMIFAYIYSNKKVNFKLSFLSGSLVAVIFYFIRLFPIPTVIRGIMTIACLCFFSIKMNNIAIKEAVQSISVLYVVQFIAEGINLMALKSIYLDNADILQDPLKKALLAFPSIVFMAILLYVMYYRKTRLKTIEIDDSIEY